MEIQLAEPVPSVEQGPPVTADLAIEEPPPNLLRQNLVAFLHNKLAVAGVVIVVLLVAFCFLGPLFLHADPSLTDLEHANEAPGTGGHLLGTDEVGRDVTYQLMVGGRSSIFIGAGAALLSMVLGALWGAAAGYVGGILDSLMMRIVDAAMAVPGLFLLIVIASMLQPTPAVMILVLAGLSWLGPARLVRGEAIMVRSREYVQSAKLMGGTRRRVIFRHILPATMGTVVVAATFQVADAVLALAALSYLGLGVPPPSNDWGSMLSTGITYANNGYWWLILPPGLAIVFLVLALNFVGDGLREVFDARLRGR